jgi:RimJ/RimL family protein N-acetyltransferase
MITRYFIKKLKPNNVSKSYVDTINHNSTKQFILYSKKSENKKTKKDLINYINNLSENDILYGIFLNGKTHTANFKITINNNKAYIGFLVFLNFRGKGIIKKIFNRILKLKVIKENNIKYIYLGVNKKNINAISLYKKIGFKYKYNSNKLMYYKI